MFTMLPTEHECGNSVSGEFQVAMQTIADTKQNDLKFMENQKTLETWKKKNCFVGLWVLARPSIKKIFCYNINF